MGGRGVIKNTRAEGGEHGRYGYVMDHGFEEFAAIVGADWSGRKFPTKQIWVDSKTESCQVPGLVRPN